MCKEFLAIQDPARKASLIRRLREKTVFNPTTSCLEWVAKAVNNGGYGNISAGRSFTGMRAHRLAWVLSTEESIPEGIYVIHSCDNPKCCNIEHLSLGTPKDNMDDKMSKGRGTPPPVHTGDDHPLRKNPELASRGGSNGNSKLTDEIVKEILLSSDSLSILANKYLVNKTTISSIRNRKTWKHVEV